MNNDSDLILPEANVELHAAPAPSQREKKPHLFLILGGIAFVILAGALLFVILGHSSDSSTDPEEPDTFSIESYKYDDLAFNDNITAAENYLRTGDYLSAKSTLEKYPLPERMTAFQKYRYYTTLALIYSDSAIGDPELAERYRIYAAENLDLVRKGES